MKVIETYIVNGFFYAPGGQLTTLYVCEGYFGQKRYFVDDRNHNQFVEINEEAAMMMITQPV